LVKAIENNTFDKEKSAVEHDNLNVSFIGFGEAAQAFAEGLRQEKRAVSLQAFDLKTAGPEAHLKHADYNKWNVVGKMSSADACHKADLIFSLVTADQAENAASAAAETNLCSALFLDCNSCAPDTKKRSAKKITAAGGRYIDLSIMTPVHPNLHKSSCLMAGAEAQAALDVTTSLGMNTKVVGRQVGAASVRKMVRSVMVKGLEALTLECFLAARAAGIEDEVISSLETSYPGFGWAQRAPYMLERMITHGNRRADEMLEVAQTLRDLEIKPHMASAITKCHREVGLMELDSQTIDSQNLGALSDAILKKLSEV